MLEESAISQDMVLEIPRTHLVGDTNQAHIAVNLQGVKGCCLLYVDIMNLTTTKFLKLEFSNQKSKKLIDSFLLLASRAHASF